MTAIERVRRDIPQWTDFKRIEIEKLAGWIVLFLIAASAVVHSRMYAGSLTEGVFFNFRHAANLVHGKGFTCNIGEHAEGTAAPLFALALSIPIAFDVNPYQAAAGLGTLGFVGCVLAAYLTVRQCLQGGASRWLGLWAAALVAASPTFALQSQTGTEQLPYASGIAAALCLYVGRVTGRSRSTAWAWVFGLCSLIRPDAVIPFCVLLTVEHCRTSDGWRRTAWDGFAFVLVLAPWLMIRGLYFGRWDLGAVLGSARLPVTTHGPGIFERIGPALSHASIDWLAPFLRTHVVFALLASGCLLLKQLRRWGLVLIVLLFAYGGLEAMRTDAHASPNAEAMLPTLVPSVVAVALGLRGYLFHQEQRVRGGHLPSYIILGLAVLWSLSSVLERPLPASAALANVNKWRAVGQHFAPTARQDDWAVSEVSSSLPYYWGISMLEVAGVCDAHRAREGRASGYADGRFAAKSLAHLRPTFFVLSDLDSAAKLYRDAAFHPYRQQYYYLQMQYRLLESLKPPLPSLFVRKDRPEVHQLAKLLGARLVDPGDELRRLGFDL